MTNDQKELLLTIIRDFTDEAARKYEKGTVEHGTLLSDLTPAQLTDEAINEAIDQVMYLYTLRKKMRGEV